MLIHFLKKKFNLAVIFLFSQNTFFLFNFAIIHLISFDEIKVYFLKVCFLYFEVITRSMIQIECSFKKVF